MSKLSLEILLARRPDHQFTAKEEAFVRSFLPPGGATEWSGGNIAKAVCILAKTGNAK